MITKKNKKLEEFKRFALSLDKTDKIAVLHDSDPDGTTSATIVSKAIERLRGKKPEMVFFQYHSIVSLQDNTIKNLKKNRINKLIILDLAVDQDAKQIIKAEKILSKILILDHHKTYHNASSKKTVFLKANNFSFIDPSKYATAKLAYDLFSEVTDINDLKWLACVGLLGDYSIRPWKKFFDSTFMETGAKQKDFKDLVELVESVETVDRPKISELFREFCKAKNYKDMKHSKYAKYKKIVEAELKKLLKEFDKKKQVFPKQELVFFYFKSKFDIKSILINNVSSKQFPEKTVVIVEDKGKGILTISARRQDYRVKMNELLEKSVSSLPGGIGGGHIPAAGGKINKKDLEKFKQNLLKNLS